MKAWRASSMGSGFTANRDIPQQKLGLRNISDSTYTIIDETEGDPLVIGSLDEISAFFQIHTHAVYLHNGQTYFVDQLDTERKIARVSQKSTGLLYPCS